MLATLDAAALRALRCTLKALGFQALAACAQLQRPVTVRASDGLRETLLTVRPAGSGQPAPGESFPGLHFSPLESAVYHALAGGPMPAKKLARAVGQRYTPTFRTILRNLLDRHVLAHDAAGYSRRKTGGDTARHSGG